MRYSPAMETLPVTLSSLAVAGAIYCAFFFALLGAAMVLPGPVVTGFPSPDGTRKHYTMNGLSLWVATHIVLGAGILVLDWSPAHLVRNFWSYFAVVNVFAVAWMAVLYVGGQRRRTAKPRGAGLRGLVADLWYGVELNPAWRGVDLKVFAYQPSLIGLSLLNLAFAWAQWEQHGGLTPQMIAFQTFWWLYLTTHYLREVGVLSMWDVIAEEFGFMLVWGDLVLVPFFYCIGGWWLVGDPRGPIGTIELAGLFGLFGLGLWIFRGANAQKDRFKRDPEAKIWGRPAQTLGGRLLVSGWWGIGRKINYTGEIMLYGAIALCTGFQSVVPYLLPLWLCVLLSHRAWRDEKRCRAKYGALWDEYCARARFRMIPFIY
jgi:delta14-sterol reductase